MCGHHLLSATQTEQGYAFDPRRVGVEGTAGSLLVAGGNEMYERIGSILEHDKQHRKKVITKQE